MPKNNLTTHSAAFGLRQSPASQDDTARTVDFVLTTESRVPVWDWERGRIDEILLMSGCSFPEQVPLLDVHSRCSIEDQLGPLRGLRMEGESLLATAHFSSTAEDAFRKVAEGHLTDISEGYSVDESYWIPEGETGFVGESGHSFAGPVRVVSKWTVREGSLTPIGADDAAKARSQQCNPKATMPNTLPSQTTPEPVATPPVQKNRSASEPLPVTAPDAVQEPVVPGDAARAADILSLAVRHGMPKLAERAIRGHVSLDAFPAAQGSRRRAGNRHPQRPERPARRALCGAVPEKPLPAAFCRGLARQTGRIEGCMDLGQDLAQVIGDLGTYATLDPDGEARTVYMVCRQNYSGVDSIRNKLFVGGLLQHFPRRRLGLRPHAGGGCPDGHVRSSALRPAGRHGATLAHGSGPAWSLHGTKTECRIWWRGGGCCAARSGRQGADMGHAYKASYTGPERFTAFGGTFYKIERSAAASCTDGTGLPKRVQPRPTPCGLPAARRAQGCTARLPRIARFVAGTVENAPVPAHEHAQGRDVEPWAVASWQAFPAQAADWLYARFRARAADGTLAWTDPRRFPARTRGHGRTARQCHALQDDEHKERGRQRGFWKPCRPGSRNTFQRTGKRPAELPLTEMSENRGEDRIKVRPFCLPELVCRAKEEGKQRSLL